MLFANDVRNGKMRYGRICMKFFGRERQLEDLKGLWGKRVSSLCTCRGRRRIGKSTLIEQFARMSGARFIKVEGVRPKEGYTNKDELSAFAVQLAVQTGAETTAPANWLNAFIRLDREIRDNEKTVVLIDEISWFGYYDAMFPDMVKIAWDNYWKKHDRLIVVLCGSISGWIKENIIDNGAFFGRRSLDIVVGELPLSQCVKFWGTAAARIDLREMLDVMSVTGGVPRYLEEVDPSLSASENIRKMAFRANSTLRTDFDEMFTDVVTRQTRLSGRLIRLLAGGPMTVTELSDALGMEKGGKLSSALGQLCESGFVALDAGRNPETGARIRERRYRIKDNYARFYLKYIEPSKETIDDGSYSFVSLASLDGWESVMGFAFENLVVNNYAELLPLLHLGNALIESAAPYRRTGDAGVQIDLLMQTRRALYVVEVKRQREIGREVEREVEQKVERLGKHAGRSVRTALVYEGNLAPIVEADDFFDSIVPVRELMGLPQ